MKRRTGEYKILGDRQYFIPKSLPPADPPLVFSPELIILIKDVMSDIAKLIHTIKNKSLVGGSAN